MHLHELSKHDFNVIDLALQIAARDFEEQEARNPRGVVALANLRHRANDLRERFANSHTAVIHTEKD